MTTTNQDAVYLDPSLTLALAQASVAAYSDYLNEKYSCPPNYIFWGRFTGWDGWLSIWGQEERFGLIFKYNGPNPGINRFIVAFRGTTSLSDMYSDLFWEFTSFQPYANQLASPPNVAAGFYDIYATKGDTMKATMQQQIFSRLPDEAAEVYITGHSLGGALSQLFTLDMSISSPRIKITTINFASPRVGDKSWQSLCNKTGATKNISRVVNYWDDVPDFPSKFFDYVSIGAQFTVAFSRYYTWDANLLSDHSLLNYQFVLNYCVWNSPQVWVGYFNDLSNPYYLMYSTATPALSKENWIAKRKELDELKATYLKSAE